MLYCGLMERKTRLKFRNISYHPMLKDRIFIKKLIEIEKKKMTDGSLKVIGNIKLIKIIHLN